VGVRGLTSPENGQKTSQSDVIL